MPFSISIEMNDNLMKIRLFTAINHRESSRVHTNQKNDNNQPWKALQDDRLLQNTPHDPRKASESIRDGTECNFVLKG